MSGKTPQGRLDLFDTIADPLVATPWLRIQIGYGLCVGASEGEPPIFHVKPDSIAAIHRPNLIGEGGSVAGDCFLGALTLYLITPDDRKRAIQSATSDEKSPCRLTSSATSNNGIIPPTQNTKSRK